VTCSGVELKDDSSVANAQRDEVSEPGRVVGVVQQQAVVGARRLEHETDVDRKQSVADRLIGYERRPPELR